MTPNKFLQDRSGIYGIRNIINNKLYVGRTICMYKRCHQYCYSFKTRNSGHLNIYLLSAMVKVGIDNFEFFPIEFAPREKLEELELYWMTYYRTCESNFGYNLRQDVGKVYKVHPETSVRISSSLKEQWKSGKRNEHSNKLKESWNMRDREAQSILFSQIKTKYEYDIEKDGIVQNGGYSLLKELGLTSILSTFHRSKLNTGTIKGFKITRYCLGERNEN